MIGHIDEARETTCLAILAAVTGQTDLRTQQSESGVVEQNDFLQFWVSIFSISAGAIPSASIDITGMTAVMSQSRAGGAFSAAGITQPVFAKANGKVSCAYQFLLAEWEMGDVYRLDLSGIKATVGGDVVFLQDMVWSNIVVEAADLETTVNTINTVQGAEADAATLDDLSNVTTTSTEAKLRRLLLRLAPGAFAATIQGASQTNLAAMVGVLATYISASGGAFSQVINPGSAARTNIELAFKDLSDILAGAGITTYPASAVPGNGVSIAQVVSKIYDLVTDTAIEADVNTSLNTIVPATPTAGALTDILSKAGGGNTFDKTTDSLEALADAITAASTGIGTVFSIVKSVTHSDIVGAGIALTTASSGLLELITAYAQNGAVAMTSAGGTAKLELANNNVSGSDLYLTDIAEANLGANTANPMGNSICVLESGKIMSATAISEAFTSAGTVDIYLVFRRQSAGATIAAA